MAKKHEKGQREVRNVLFKELRIQGDEGEPRKIVGHAAVFNEWTNIGGMFRERVVPGAFKKTLKRDDIRALFNHDENYVLGRNQAGTLTMTEDDEGLYFEAEPPDTQWARDLMVSIERGDITGCSFSFQTVRDKWGTDDAGFETRDLVECILFDVGPVTFPAYPQTDTSVRSALAECGIDFDALSTALLKGQDDMAEADIETIRASIEALREHLPSEPPELPDVEAQAALTERSAKLSERAKVLLRL